jgi:hypothetical protein
LHEQRLARTPLLVIAVLRFNSPKRSSVRNYQSRREQWRLLLLVMSLGVVIFAIRGIQRPESIAAFSGLFSRIEQNRDVDASTLPGQTQAPAIEVRRQQSDSDPPSNPAEFAAGVRQEAISAIRDNAPFRTAEQEAWFALLATLRDRSDEDLASHSQGIVSAAQLIAQPHVYRAKLVTIHGTVRRVTSERPATNDLGITSYFLLVIQPRGESVPVFAYCLSLPEEFPRGNEVAVEVAATGYFFKNRSYESEGGPAIAPVILMNSVAPADSTHARRQQESVERQPTIDAPKQDDAQIDTQIFHESMALAGWNDQRWASFADELPATDAERKLVSELLWRLRTFRVADLDAWSQRDISLADLSAAVGENRGKLVRLTGRVRRVTRRLLPPADAARLELPEYFQCEMELDEQAGVAQIVATTIPASWHEGQPLDEKAAASAVVLKRLPNRDGGAQSVLAAARNIAWYPERPREPDVSFGHSLLGGLGMDVALLEVVRNHRPIRAEERDAFLAMLAAVGESGAHQLIRFAQGNLKAIDEAWSKERESPDAQRRMLAREVAERAQKGLYSVAPLFNDADRQIGRLLSLEGVVRRAMRVDLGKTQTGQPSDVPRLFGFDHYFELDLFTDDSQNRPIVVCVRELPDGFPTGAGLDERVRVAGFFFKSWHYFPRADRAASDDVDAAADRAAGRGLISPLLVGRAPVRLVVEEAASRLPGVVGACLFVLAFASVWGLVWWYSRDEHRFHERTLKPRFALPAGVSLNHLNDAPLQRPQFDPAPIKSSATSEAS